MNAMRRMAALLGALILIAQVGAVEAMQDAPAKPRPQPMTPSEEARLVARAAQRPQLENFTAGSGEEWAYLLAFAVIVAFSAVIGNLIACPLGWSHSSQGKTFVPAECLKTDSKTVNYFNGCAVILGFPLYALGYLIGLPFATPEAPKPLPPADDGKGLEWFFLGSTVDVLGELKITGVSVAAERAGLEVGDVILEIDDVEGSRANLASVMARVKWGDSLDVLVLRQGCRLPITIFTGK